jgi:SET domain-containing protein
MIAPKVVVRHGSLGKGIYARKPLRAGESILTFDGPVLSHSEVLALGDHQAYALQIGPDSYVDTIEPGRFTNHSCEPNAGIVADRLLIALRPIAAGEEIHFDYSTTMSENHWTMECRCSRPGCRRVIRDFHYLPPALQTRYLRLGVVQQFIVREWHDRPTAPLTSRREALSRVPRSDAI